tara:strand:- start:518 stop:850 length:333 start_codon:yes stop_codon:yes gene_type:complete
MRFLEKLLMKSGKTKEILHLHFTRQRKNERLTSFPSGQAFASRGRGDLPLAETGGFLRSQIMGQERAGDPGDQQHCRQEEYPSLVEYRHREDDPDNHGAAKRDDGIGKNA